MHLYDASNEEIIEYLQNTVSQSGFIYLIRALGTNRYKIGYTRRLKKRIKELQGQSPFPIELKDCFCSKYPTGYEKLLHRVYQGQQVFREWFELSTILNSEEGKSIKEYWHADNPEEYFLQYFLEQNETGYIPSFLTSQEIVYCMKLVDIDCNYETESTVNLQDFIDDMLQIDTRKCSQILVELYRDLVGKKSAIKKLTLSEQCTYCIKYLEREFDKFFYTKNKRNK